MTTVNSTATPVCGTQGAAPTSPLAAALRAILAEVTPGIRPYSSDSYLPHHLIDAARAALAANDQVDLGTHQTVFNGLSTAALHIARGEPAKAIARLRRVQSHIRYGMEGVAA